MANRGSNLTIQFTEHARTRAAERDISVGELTKILPDHKYVKESSKQDPETKRYVLHYKDLRIIYQILGQTITILSVFSK
jgi:mRNA-degrading endonuclease RelE of RelBE toxin-antitoxin system